TFLKKIRNSRAVFSDTRRLRRMPANELSGRFYYQRCSDQPSGCRKLEQKGVDKTGFIISSMNCEALLGVSSAHQHRCNRTAITIDHRIPEPELNLSERWHGPSPLGLPAQFPQRTLPHAVTPEAKGVRCPIR